MSSFMVTNATINAVVHLLDLDACCCPQGKLGMQIETPDGLRYQGEVFGWQLQQLNARATNHRYAHSGEPVCYEAYRWSPKYYSPMQMLKSAWCWMYQCTEGEQFIKADIFVEVERKADRLCRHIVSHLADYDAAAWDLLEDRRGVGQLVETTI